MGDMPGSDMGGSGTMKAGEEGNTNPEQEKANLDKDQLG